MTSTRRFLAAALIAAAASAWPASAAPAGYGQLAGAGTATGAGCSGPFQLTGVSVAASSWSFTVAFAGAATSICGVAGVPVASGAWNPADGGCLTGTTGIVCVGAVPATGVPTTVTVSFCIPGSACYSGTGTVVRL
ncbi:MAG TPA: hypothetical protein VGB64_05435 [Actinomycetota bacterium]